MLLLEDRNKASGFFSEPRPSASHIYSQLIRAVCPDGLQHIIYKPV